MKLFYIECDESEMRANRTILDTISSCMNTIVDKIAGISISEEAIQNAIESFNQNESEEE